MHGGSFGNSLLLVRSWLIERGRVCYDLVTIPFQIKYYLRWTSRILLPLVTALSVLGCDARLEPKPFLFQSGPMTFRPSGFFEGVGMYRTATTGDTINTRFGRIPLNDTASESLFSAGHSRIQLCAQTGNLSVYVETDFLNAPGKEPYRFRQYWGEYRIGKWRILGGQAWSLLRPNREGINSEGGLMNSLVIDPAYHVGLAGLRNRQLRITRDSGSWHMAVSYEAGKSFLGKLAHDSRRLHLEAAGLGSVHRRAGSLAAAIHAPHKIDFITQEVISQGAGPELLNTLPPGAHTYSTFQGLEMRIRPTWEIFAYGGLVYGGRATGNRNVREWTAGFIHHLFEEQPWGAASVSAQISQMDRSTWQDGHGDMNYVQVSFRYSLPGSRSMFSGRR